MSQNYVIKGSKKVKQSRKGRQRRRRSYWYKMQFSRPKRFMGQLGNLDINKHVVDLHKTLLDEKVRNVNDIKDQKIVSSYRAAVSALRGMIRQFWGPHTYKVDLSSYSGLQTNGASVPCFVDIGANTPYISLSISSTTVSEWTSWSALFDEFKVEGISLIYEPFNPYNRGVSVASDLIGFLYDDNADISPTISGNGFKALCENTKYFEVFSPDVQKLFGRNRPTPIHYYDWSSTANSGGASSSLGSVSIGSPGTLTASTRYGAVRYTYHILFQQRT